MESPEPHDDHSLALAHHSDRLAPWQELRKAKPEVEDIRLALEQALAPDALTDLVISLHLHEPPKSKVGRRQFATSLAPYVRSAAARLHDAPSCTSIDVRAAAEEAGDPRTLELYTSLNDLNVRKVPLGGPALIFARDTRFTRWEPPVMPRLIAKAESHKADAPHIVLLIEVEAADMSPESFAEFVASVPAGLRMFQALYLCDRNHSLGYKVLRVY